MIRGIEHIAIASPDPHQLADWYVRNLDFTVFSSSDRVVFIKATNGALLEIITADNRLPAPAMKDSGLRHVAIAVDDFDAVYQRLKSAGITFLGDPSLAGENKLVFFNDPDGNYVHLIFRPTPFI